MTESTLKNQVQESLSEHFSFFQEVQGTHFSGKRLRLDQVIVPRNTALWKNKNVAFGLEYKNTERIDGDTTNFTKWLAQCVDYSNTNWDGFGYLYILACPGITSTSFIQTVDRNFMLPRIMAHMGIGELKPTPNYGWSIMLQETHRIWSIEKGVESGRNWSLIRKFGSR